MTNHQRGPSMRIITTIGLDLAKKVFHVHGVDAEGNVVVARRLRRKEVLAQSDSMPGRHRGLRQRALLGARDCEARAHREAYTAEIRQALCQTRQDGSW